MTQPTNRTGAPPPPASQPTNNSNPPPPARIIKRYSNRKLYDTVESRYVTLPQIAALVRKDENVRIIDNNTKEDLTRVTLAQIVYEEERKQSRALPLTALKELISTSGEKLMTSLREGPIGKLIPSRPEQNPSGDAAAPAETKGPESTPPEAPAPVETKAPESKPPEAPAAETKHEGNRLVGMFEQSRASIQEWQQRVDERVRKTLEELTPTNPLEKLREEVRKLEARIAVLEAELARRDGSNVTSSKRDAGTE